MDFPVEAVCPQWSTLHPGYAANPPIVFNFIEGFGHELSLTGLSLSRLQLPTEDGAGVSPAVFVVIAKEKEIEVQLKSHDVTYSQKTAMGYLEAYRSILRRLVEEPDSRVCDRSRDRQR